VSIENQVICVSGGLTKEKKRESERGRGQVFVTWENWKDWENAAACDPNIGPE
jgi:hypothetical protein